VPLKNKTFKPYVKSYIKIYEIKFKHYNVKDTVTFSHNVLVV